MRDVLKRIEKTRLQKNLSQERLAEGLNISQAAYTKLERGETKLSVERLFQISEILKTKITDLLGIENNFNQDIYNNDQATIIAPQKIENLYNENKEMTEKLMKYLEQAIEDKNKIIKNLEDYIKNTSLNNKKYPD